MRLFACVLLLTASTASAQDVTEYRDVRDARPDGRAVPVKGLTLVRDNYRIQLNSGVVHLLKPAGSDTFGGIFIGDGEYELQPATDVERRHLQLVTGDPKLETLSDRFSRLILLFTDRTAAELAAHAPATTGPPDAAATRVYDDYLQRQLSRGLPNLHIRVLADLLNRPGRTDGVFLAVVEGQKYPPALIAVDPLGTSSLSSRFVFYGGEEVAFISFDESNGGFWYSSTLGRDAVGGRGKPTRLFADATRYEIDTTIDSRTLRGTTTITLTPGDAIRVLPVHIFNKLQIRAASMEGPDGPQPVGVVQDEVQQGWFSRLVNGDAADADAAVVFRTPLARGVPVRLKIEYEGRDVLSGTDGRYSVRARESWYPNLGTFADLATYDMTFRFPQRNELVAVGELVSERVEGGQKIAVWKSGSPIRVAGFNYGEFTKRSQKDADTGIGIEVYTQREWTSMAPTAMADAANTFRVGSVFFGAPPFPRVAITQQVEWEYGQSWPSLVFLPTSALTTSTQRAMGLDGVLDPRAIKMLNEFANTVGWHEVAHQWWGHQVGWSSYRDQWLSEGFAEFTAALLLELTTNRKSADTFWELRRGEILDPAGPVPNAAAGPITQGVRLSTSHSPAAAQAIVYSKGAFIVHMLRMMMRQDRTAEPDRAFRTMMREFVSTWSGKSPTTADFQAVAERHMTPVMNLGGNGRLDYFFNQWVYGTEIPLLTSALEATEVSGKRYRIAGTVTQAGVPAGFVTLVPIYVDFGNDRLEKIGTIPLSGSVTNKVSAELELPQRPRRVIINAMHDVLSR